MVNHKPCTGFYLVSISRFNISLFSINLTTNEEVGNIVNSEELTNLKDNIENASLSEKSMYKTANLKTVGNWVTDNITNIKIKINELNSNNSDYFTVSAKYLISLIQEKEINTDLAESLNVFTNLEGENWYPTITFVVSNEDAIYLRSNDNPIIAIKNNVNGQEIYEGYEENENGELELYYEQLAEEEHANREIAIIELSQCDAFLYDGAENIDLSSCGGVGDSGINDSGGNDSGSGNDNQPTVWRTRIDRMTVRYHKESWPGRSEIQFHGFHIVPNPISGDCGLAIEGGANCYNYSGKRIDRLKRREIGDNRNYDYIMREDNNAEFSGYTSFLIFEGDSWLAHKRTKVFNYPNGGFRKIYFRSWQSHYDSETVRHTFNDVDNSGFPFVNGHVVDKSSIKYNLTRGL